MRVFIENPAGSRKKHLHDEKTLQLRATEDVARRYPFPYGFVLDTTSEDDDNVDCFVITPQALRTGQIVTCDPVGLMEQIEDGKADRNVIAVLPGEGVEFGSKEQSILIDFVSHVFEHKVGK